MFANAPTVKVKHVLEVVKRTCDLGCEHKVTVYAEKTLHLTDLVRINEIVGGYSDSERENPVYEDAQGRLYDRYTPVDYYSGVRFVRRDDKTHWRNMAVLRPCIRYDDTTGDDPATWPSVG